VPAIFTVQIEPSSIPAGITSTAIVTATVTDTSGNPLLGQEVEMEVTEGRGIVTGVTDNGDGTYTGNYRATNQTGTEIITITVMGISETVSIVLTEPGGAQLSIQSSYGSLPADGASTAIITATVTDDAGNPLAGQDVEMTVSTGQGTLSSVADNGDGTYTATYTASDQPGTETVTVAMEGNSQALDIVLTEVEVIVDAKELIIPEVTGAPGDSITVPINISDAAGVSGADITVAYDANVLTATEGRKTALSSAMNLETNIGIPEQVILSMASTEPIASGSGALVEMVFTISANAEADTETPLTFADAELYDAQLQTIPAETQDGKVVIGPACMKGDVNGNGRIQSNDAILTLRISAQLMTATPYQECAADMNDDGRVRANDAIAILRTVAGLTAPGVDSAVNISRQVGVTLAEARGVAGETIAIPLKVDDTAGVAGGDVCIAYNSKVLRAVDVSSNSSVLLASNAAEPGTLRIAFASIGKLSGETVAEIQFCVLTDGVSPLKIQNVELYGTDALSLDSRPIDRQFESWAIPAERNALLQNFPNPFNPETWIPYQLKEESDVVISIYNTAGDLIRELNLGHKSAGFYVSSDRAAYWDGMNKDGETVSSGVYFYSIRTNDFADVRKLTILK
jgi:adhesin/invasin